MTSNRRGKCEWCGADTAAAPRGPLPRYCSHAHRQAAYRARTGGARGESPELAARLGELARVVATPGEASNLALWVVARELVAAAGRPVPDELDDPRGRPADGVARRAARPQPWDGHRLDRPSAAGLDRMYQRTWDRDWGWQVLVRVVRGGRAPGDPKPLWLRRHRASEDPSWRIRYDWTDQWDVPDVVAVHHLANDLVADALDRPRTAAFRQWHKLGHLARHFTGDVLWRLGDSAWHLRRSEIINWLDLHGYLEPVT